MLCPIKVNSNTIELTVHTSFYCILDLLCVIHIILPRRINYHDVIRPPFIKNIGNNVSLLILTTSKWTSPFFH